MPRNPLATLLVTAALAALPHLAAAQIGSLPVEFWEQTSAGIGMPLQDDAFFGQALAAGDFDGDGFEDLAIGVPDYDSGMNSDVGAVVVLYGSWGGLTTDGLTWFTQDHPSLQDAAEQGDKFGWTLAAGNFDGDDYDDLAIGIPYEHVAENVSDAGAVQVIYGSATGLDLANDQFIYQGIEGELEGTPEELDRFGWSLAVGDFDDDGRDDLVVGVPYEQISDQNGAGAFHVIFGSDTGLTPTGNRFFYLGQDLPRVPAANENLAWSLAAGEFDSHSAGDELAVGAPGTSVGGQPQAGTVWIVSDLDGTTAAVPLDLDDVGMPDDPENGDLFGWSLAAGQFDGAGLTDLAIGAFQKAVDEHDNAGKVYVYYFGGATPAVFTQDGLPSEQAEANDYFGGALAAGDFDADGLDDLAASSYFESGSTGVVNLLYGSKISGLTIVGAQTLVQQVDTPEAGDKFGQAMVTGHFSGHSGSDLAVGAPSETDGIESTAGGVNVFFSIALFLDGFESGLFTEWSAVSGAF